jgi:replication factor A1
VVLSDGVNYVQGMLATQVNKLVEQNLVTESSIVRVNETLTNTVHGKKIAIVLSMDVLVTTAPQIGDPQPMDGGALAPPTGAAATTAPVAAAAVPAAAVPYAAAASTTTSAYQSSAAGHFQPYSTMAPMAAESSGAIYPVTALSPYMNRWTIKVRVTKKGDVKTYTNAKGDGKLLSVDLLDGQGGEIRATMFNEQVDQFSAILEKNHVYLISGGSLKPANRKFTTFNNEFELTFNSSTTIQPVSESGDIKMQQYAFCPIGDIAHKEKDDMVDVIGVVTQVGQLGSITTKKGDQLAKRTVVLLDTSTRSIELTLWGAIAENFSAAGSPVLACKAVRVSDYAGRSLGTMSASALDINPAGVPEVQQLRQWVDAQGGVANIVMYPLTVMGGSGGGAGGASAAAEFKTFDEVQRNNLGTNSQAMFECEAIITMLNREGTWMYNACPKEDCKKKVTQDHVGGWRCEKCNMTYPECNPRYVLSMTASDATGKLWISLFNDEAVKVLGMSAKDLQQLSTQDQKAFERVFESALYQTVTMKVKARMESFNEAERVKYSAMSLNFIAREKGGDGWGASIARLTRMLEAM